MTSKVVILKTNPNTVIEDYSELMDRASYRKAIKTKELILKLNLSWSLYYPACSTEPWQLDGVLKKLYKHYNVHAVENRTVVTNPMKGAKLNKWLPVLDKYNLKFTPLTNVKWVDFHTKKYDTPYLDSLFQGNHKIPEMFIRKSVVHLPTLKTHGHTKFTGSLKNAFGGLITKRRHHSHKIIDEILVDLLKVQREIHPSIFTVTDGTVSGNGAGPRTMDIEQSNLILASDDPIAIDAVSAKIMGFEPENIKFLKMAHEQNLGNIDMKQIDIIGEDIKKINLHFKPKKSPVVYFDQVFRKKYPVLEPLLFHTPLFNLCILASALYHDHLWYPTIGKKKIKQFKKTSWGRLFETYQ